MGLLYSFIIPNEPFAINLLFKLIPMVLIIFYAYKQLPRKRKITHWLIMIGLFICMIGDGTLRWFIVGLSAFLIGHLFYIAGFLMQYKFSVIRFLAIIPLIVFCVVIGNKLVTNLNITGNETLIIPVLFYITAIALMLFLAIMTGNIWVSVGSILFVISDSILAWNKFIDPVVFSGQLIMITYYSAQFFIAHSMKTIVRE